MSHSAVDLNETSGGGDYPLGQVFRNFDTGVSQQISIQHNWFESCTTYNVWGELYQQGKEGQTFGRP